MVHELINGTYRQTNLLSESGEYLVAGEKLRNAEIELMRKREQVAALRRALPQGPVIKDYEFFEGPTALQSGDDPIRSVKLSELFSHSGRSLVIYHLMFGKKQVKPCPMCTLWTDAANGVAEHMMQNIDFAVVAAADLKALRDHARTRNWNRVRLLSAGRNTFKYDLGSEDTEGNQDSAVSVFSKEANGTVRHAYTAHPRMGLDIKERGIDLLVPLWHFLDLTSKGREDWYPSLAYEKKASTST